MGMIVISVGATQLGSMRTAPNGDVVSVTPAVWKPDSKGGSVAIWPLNPETMEQDGPAEVFGDWQAAEYLARVLELLHPNRQINVPDLPAMVRAACKDVMDICHYCHDCNCRDCIVNEWKGDAGGQ